MDWGAEEESLLLEGVELHNWGNWGDISEHVLTKSPEQCQDHYKLVYTRFNNLMPDASTILTVC